MIFELFQKIRNRFPTKKETEAATHEGIITLADAHYFEGLKLLYFSVQKNYTIPIVCFDIGLNSEQKEWAANNLPLLTIQDIPDDKMINIIKNHKETTALAKKGKRQWPLWICPFLIQNSPFTKTLWLDCDLIVLRNLDTLFKKLDKGPFFTPENLAPHVTANKPELYHLLPIKHRFNEQNALINAGVSGWHLERDKNILKDYAQVVTKAFQDENIKNAISWHDQGSLIWAILKNRLENRIAKSWEWNLCVKHTQVKGMRFTWNNQLLDELRTLVPEANIIHWNGQPVPWL